jgi:uncharacterized protein YceK
MYAPERPVWVYDVGMPEDKMEIRPKANTRSCYFGHRSPIILVHPRIACCVLLLVWAALPPFADAQPVITVLHAGGSGTPLLPGPGGVLYGVGGGQIFPECPGGCGGIFSLTPPATGKGPWTETTIYPFTSIQDGIGAAGDTLIMSPNGVLYGSTGFGGTGCNGTGCGTVFSLTPPAVPGAPWTKATFALNGPDLPNSLVLSNGVLYGTSYDGGTSSECFQGCGTFFSVTPPSAGQPAWSVHVLYGFTGGADAHPVSLVAGGNGEFFGTAGDVACPSGCSYVFSMTQDTPGSPWKETVLYTDTDTDAVNNVISIVVASNGVIYGTIYYGGAHGVGSVFSLTPPASPGGSWTETTLYSFAGVPDAAQPNPGLAIGAGGVLYGTSNMGGVACQLSSMGCGTVFSLTPPSSPGGVWTEQVLHAFDDGDVGAWPTTGLALGTDGVLYGSTTVGPGRIEGGFLFSLQP